MFIKDMFVKPIDRDIKGVIKVGQANDENVKQELEEYVVTKEMQKHFAEFFSNYKKGIHGETDKMGVWVSGFFGSGKSHFLKILSYLLENKHVNGKKAIAYFEDDQKIIDPMVLADMKLAVSVPTDVILFNIDSKSEMPGKQSKDAIIMVFLKVFNEMQGLCSATPLVADLERQLIEKGKYDTFKQKFHETYKQPWDESRHKFDFIQDAIVEVLADMNFMSETAAWNWCERATEPYQISIEDFAKRVQQYLKQKGRKHHIVFLVDEIGQYIGDDSRLMLNLQTVAEELGTACAGKAWLVVTSQQDIDSITKTVGNDFSKIQGRFDTRLSLSSANVDEVIKKRILDKNTTGEQTLRVLYEQKSTIIKNLIVFNDSVEKKLYANETHFARVYPFVPYQFNLLASVLTSIRTHGATGKHLSEGERSMLALFKESAVKIMNKAHGALIPFNLFYDALHQFLDHSHKSVISRALENNRINPEEKEECFTVNVLKTLFMIKYVKEIKANLDNITSLMIADIDDDRINLKKQVEESLNILMGQMLVQKNGEIYVFLTDEEQEINREINNQNAEMGDVIRKASEIIFEDIFSEKKYRYPEHNGRYNFAFNQIVDERSYKSNQNHDIGVQILTPWFDGSKEDATLRLKSGQGKEILIVLPDDSAFLDELSSALKIEKYLRLATSNTLANFQQIKDAKQVEMRERNNNAKLFLQEAMKDAAIYVNGNRASIGTKDVTLRINDALGGLVSNVYHKLYYIDTPMSEANIRELFKADNQQSLSIERMKDANVHAVDDVLSFIETNSAMHIKTSMKSIMNRFMKAPYGFVEDDVEWIVAKLFKDGDITLTVNGEIITFMNRKANEIIQYITKKDYVEKLLTDRRNKAGMQEKKIVKDVMKELFGVTSVNDDDDSLMQSFLKYCQECLSELEKYEIMYHETPLPGKTVILQGKQLLRTVTVLQDTSEFYTKIKGTYDDFLDFAEDYEPVKVFLSGEQRKIYQRALNAMGIFEKSKTFIADEKVEADAQAIMTILKKERPYQDIPKLPDLLDRFNAAYKKVLKEMETPIIEAIEDAKNRVFKALQNKPYEETYREQYGQQFREIHEKAINCENAADLQNIKNEADTLKIRLLEAIDKKDQDLVKEDPPIPGKKPEKQPPVKRKKRISIKNVNTSSTWRISSVQELDQHISDLRERILNELEQDTIINIEF